MFTLKRAAVIFLLVPFFFSCSLDETPRLTVGQDFYYWEASADSTPADAAANAGNFRRLEDLTEHNLMNIFGTDRHYVWIRADFEIPPEFRNQPLGLVIPHLRFAEQLWCNGNFISQYGGFPPHEQSTMFKAHFFSFPLNILNQEGNNRILIKVFVFGDSGISSHSFIQPSRWSHASYESINFFHSRVYMILLGIMLFTFILYLCFYLNLPTFREYREFALLNLATSFLIFYFFATEVPAYTNGYISHAVFAKFTLCIPGYVMTYLTGLFAVDYYGTKSPLPVTAARNIILAVQVLPTLFAPDYDFLLKVSPQMVGLLIIQIALIVYEIVTHIINPETRTRALQFLTGFIPFIIGITADTIVRSIDNTQAYSYFLVFGWQGTITVFIVTLSIRFAKFYRRNIQLTDHLQEEVASRTHKLSELNEKLEKDKQRLVTDLEMASIVQHNFFTHPKQQFRNWDIAVWYEPLSKVSGDFYDYFSFNDILNGLSIFDVSGHGLSASLITMLSKNIISGIFQKGFRKKEAADKILSEINATIIKEKGSIQNYMTGLLCRFEEDEEKGCCRADLGNAGHPFPLKFSAEEGEVTELKGNDGKEHYGAIGMYGIKVSFARTEFILKEGDILVFFTDGITESADENKVQFGTGKIKRILEEHHSQCAEELLSLIKKELYDFVPPEKIDDDITVIIAKRSPAPQKAEEQEEILEEL